MIIPAWVGVASAWLGVFTALATLVGILLNIMLTLQRLSAEQHETHMIVNSQRQAMLLAQARANAALETSSRIIALLVQFGKLEPGALGVVRELIERQVQSGAAAAVDADAALLRKISEILHDTGITGP